MPRYRRTQPRHYRGIAKLVRHQVLILTSVGSSPTTAFTKYYYRGVEKLASRRAHNPKVVGSNPTPAIWSGGVGVNMLACHAGDRGFKSRPDRF